MADQQFHALHEIVARARYALADGPWGYLTGGAETETTMAATGWPWTRLRSDLDSYARLHLGAHQTGDRCRLRRFLPSRRYGQVRIATPDDAELAIEHGIDIICVSNHEGRQLDHGLGSAAVLAEIVDAIDGRAKVYVDGGFNRGTDIIKAMAIGADGVALGRTACYGLAAAGRVGLVRVLELLEDEVVRTLGLLGVTAWDQLDRTYLTDATPTAQPGPMSAYPLAPDGLVR